MTLDDQIRAIVRDELARSLASKPGSRVFSQVDGERPAGCGRVKFLRAWRRAREAGDAGATSDGRARLLTADAYARFGAAPASRPKVVPIRPSADDDVRAALGLAVGRR